MRNLLKYPITHDEIRKTLNDMASEIMSQSPFIMGDIRPAALLDALEQLEQYWDLKDS